MVSPGRMVIHSLLVDESGSTATEYGLQSGYYRPLFLVSLAVDRALFGLSSKA